jgi:hypothetical protein
VSYNSYGHCFGDSEYFIDGVPQILLDEYDITDKIEKADKIALLSIGLIDNNGTQTRNVVTTVNVNKNGTITYKPSVTALVANKPIAQLNG